MLPVVEMVYQGAKSRHISPNDIEQKRDAEKYKFVPTRLNPSRINL
jgi:hypothetical protein